MSSESAFLAASNGVSIIFLSSGFISTSPVYTIYIIITNIYKYDVISINMNTYDITIIKYVIESL